MAISSHLLELVPVGEENAVPGLLLWKQLNMWSPASIKHTLQQMADNGVIERQRVRRGSARNQFVFQIAQLIDQTRREDQRPVSVRRHGHARAALA